VLVGTGGDGVLGPEGGAVGWFDTPAGAMSWETTPPPFAGTAVMLQQDGQLSRSFSGLLDTTDLWTDSWVVNPNVEANLDQVYLTTMPANILTSQGLA